MSTRVCYTWDTIRTKADLLCMGVRPSPTAESMYARQNPCQEYKTGNVGVHLKLNGGSHALVTVCHAFDSHSPYLLEDQATGLVLMKGRAISAKIDEVRMPAWYQRTTTTGRSMSGIFLHEGSAFLHQTYSGCDYHSRGEACKFCAAGVQWHIGSPVEVGEVAAEAVAEDARYHVCLGGGTRLPLERNVHYFLECVRQIRARHVEAPVWVEMVPTALSDVAQLVDAGATSFGFNIEIWDDNLRREICPGKSDVSKERYLAIMERAVNLLGTNRVGCCLIVGLEPPACSIEGAKTLASIGVQPCMLPFKPWDGSAYKDVPACKPGVLVSVSEAAVDAMLANRICPEKNEGCLLCDGCTIDHDIYGLREHGEGGHGP